MRPVIAALLCLTLFSGVYAYTRFAESVRRPPLVVQPNYASGTYALHLDRTFDCVGDPDWEDVPSLLVKFRGQEVFRRNETLSHKEPVVIDPLESVEQLENEVYVFANLATSSDGWELPDDDSWDSEGTSEEAGGRGKTAALRVRVTRGSNLIADETIWSEPGATTLEGTVSFLTPAEESKEPHDH